MRSSSESDRIAEWLCRNGLQEFGAIVLEFAGPFRYLGAQVMYMLEPFTGRHVEIARDLAALLEDQEKIENLRVMLREEAG